MDDGKERFHTVTNFKSHRLDQLIDSLLNEPFAQTHHFKETSIDTIGDLLEAESQNREAPDSDNARDHSQKESYSRCKELYCLLLMELEIHHFAYIPHDTLGELREQNTKTMAISPIKEPTFNTPLSKWPFLKLHDSVVDEEGKQFLQLILSLDTKQESKAEPFTEPFLQRMATHCLISALECEAARALSSHLKIFWDGRHQAIRPYTQERNEKSALSQIENAVEKMIQGHLDWLIDKRVSYTAILRSLRYIVAVPEYDRVVPNLMDLGSLVILFGQNIRGHNYELNNLLQLRGLDPEEVTELGFKLMRTHKLKQKTAAVTIPFSETYLDMIFEDFQRIASLFSLLENPN